jgi:preprotein translocase subunit SecB
MMEIRDVPEFRARVEEIFLVHARFLDSTPPHGAAEPLPDDAGVTISIALDRQELRRITIAISAHVEFQTPYRVEVIYAAVFRLSDDVSEDAVDDYLRQCAAVLAPVVLYPFIREIVMNLTSRSRSGGFVMPVVAFQNIDLESITIPPPPPVRRAAPARSPRKRK